MLTVNNLTIVYNNQSVLNDFALSLKQGEIFALLGDSGSGKSSALRFIAGLDVAQNGAVLLDDVQLSQNGQHQIPAQDRGVGMVFQDYALFPHMNVAKNIAFGLQHLSKTQKHQRVTELLDLVDLPNIEKKYPHQLSGGEQQRVALARTLAPKPKLLLLDEPFSNLDKTHRDALVLRVREILKKSQVTSILVTHDQGEAQSFADTIGCISKQQLHLC